MSSIQDQSMSDAGLLEFGLQAVDSWRRVADASVPKVRGFEMIGLLGSGASGEVWLADELESGRTVALKILHRCGAARASEEVLQREFRILAKLIHPNLVMLYHGIITVDGRQGFAMEWIDGWPLDEWLVSHLDLPLAQKLELFQGMVHGVAYLHDHGVIHRDLKPANVIVDIHGTPKIVDFGLARLHQEEAASGMDGGSIGVSGTLHFMAPEQAANGKGARAMPVDVYALGLMLYRILTGQWLRPSGGTPAETLAQVLQPPPLILQGSARQLPRDLQSILHQSLAPDPASRYHHARELEADLIRFAMKQPVAARKHTLFYLGTTFLRRQARRSALAGGLVVAGLAVGGILYQRHRAVAERNKANLKYAYTLTSFTLQQLRDELRTATPVDERESLSGGEGLPAAAAGVLELPVNAAGELDLRYYQAMLAYLRSATSENDGKYLPALKSISSALDLFSQLALEAPGDPKRLLDAAQARLSFARLLGRVGRPAEAGDHARKTLLQVERLATWPGFDSTSLLPLRCDALRLLAQQAHHSGDSAGAVRLCEEMIDACGTLPSGLLVRPENETIPRLALAAADLATYAAALSPNEQAQARSKIERAIAAFQSAHEAQPKSFPLTCGLAHCLHATARLSMQEGAGMDLHPLFSKISNLLIDTPAVSGRSSLPLVWRISGTVNEWASTLQGHPDIAVSSAALVLAQKFTTHLRQGGDTRDEVLIQRARIFLYESRLACRNGRRKEATRPISIALSLLSSRQLRNPENPSLALLTAMALHHARSLADFPEVRWTEKSAQKLEILLQQLTEKAASLTLKQQRELAALK